MPASCSNAPTKISIAPKNSDATTASSVNESAVEATNEATITTLGEAATKMARAVHALLARFDVALNIVGDGQDIPGTFWGEPEAGLIGADLYARPDTPVHSVLHEACHYICMDSKRRSNVHTNAGGTAAEECAVCYLSIILADELPEFSRTRMLVDMDRWGYSFRLGTAAAWFEDDASDAVQWLREHALLDINDAPTWQVRTYESISDSGRSR